MKTIYKELASQLSSTNIDSLTEEIIELLYDRNLIEETNDTAMHYVNEITKQYIELKLS